ncbi:hypothetical protein PG994_011000 [Apiospora phragmitis]|uniref:Uncharacterized protein n=1 Tax=Apiospora phragmitis TaxID=2905665 RepID=A0ABR1TRJ1_9PEZI
MAVPDLNPSAGAEKASNSQQQPAHPITAQQHTPIPTEHQPSPALPYPTFCQNLGDVDDPSMYLGGDEEERALFDQCGQPTISVAVSENNNLSLPPLRPRHDAAPSSPNDTEEVVLYDTALLLQQQQQITDGDDDMAVSLPRHGWLSRIDASIPTGPPLDALLIPYYYHILSRLPVDSIPPNRPSTNPMKLRWGRSPLSVVTSPEELSLVNFDDSGTGGE